MKDGLIVLVLLLMAGLGVQSAVAGDPVWLEGSGKSCPQVCNAQNQFPVAAGTYTNGNRFYVCAANSHGEGFRSGFNLSPTWSTSCDVGWGGHESLESSYYCLCNTTNISIDAH